MTKSLLYSGQIFDTFSFPQANALTLSKENLYDPLQAPSPEYLIKFEVSFSGAVTVPLDQYKIYRQLFYSTFKHMLCSDV